MHYLVYVFFEDEPEPDVLKETVTAALTPFQNTEWDWFQIGGRWTGHLTDYNPETDPQNLDDGGKPKWPTQWRATPDHDVQPISVLKDHSPDHVPHSFVYGGDWCSRQLWTGASFLDNPDYEKCLKDAIEGSNWIVVVDCHN